MTTPPPAPLPTPAPAPAGPPKKPSSGVTALVFGIILCFIGFVYAGPRLILTLVALIIQLDAYVFGQFIGTLLFVAAFGIPGILLIRRFTRIRRAKREALAAAIWELEYDAEHDDDDVPLAAPSTAQATPPAPPIPPVPPMTPPA